MTRILLLQVILFLSIATYGQDTAITFYFKSGQSTLSAAQQRSIDNLQLRPVKRITTEGYADTIGKASFNQELSEKRAQTTAAKIKTENKNAVGKGESQEKKIRLGEMRKVVVKVWYEQPVPDPPIAAVKKETQKIDPCTDDTTIISESGSMMTLNKCYYRQIQGCFRYKEYLNAVAVQQAGLRTIDQKGNPIESGGMIDIQLCSDTCLRYPIIVYLPIAPCADPRPMSLWTINKNGTWSNSGNKIDVATINGKKYYKMEVRCPGRLNCDRKAGTKKYMKIKVQRGMRIESADLSYTCPLYSVRGKVKRNERVVKFPYNCPNQDPLLYLKAIDKDGKVHIIDNTNLNEYKRKQKIISKCDCRRKTKERYAGVFRIKQKYLYRKYKIYRREME